MKSFAEEKRIRPHILTAAVFWSAIIMMLFNIISVRIFGDMGAGYLAGPLTIFYLMYVIFILAVQKAVYAMVRLRARRSQFLNAETNMIKSFRIFVFSGAVIAILLMTCSYVIADRLFGASKIYLHIIAIGASLLFLCGQGVARGYLQGLGYTKPIFVSDILIAITSFAVGAVTSAIFYNYGKKVNELFHGDMYSAIYGASGVVIGLFAGALVGFIQIMISMGLRKKEIANIVRNGAPRYLDNKNDVMSGIRPIIILYASPIIMTLADHITYNIVHIKSGDVENMVENYGAFYGRIGAFTVLLALFCCVPFIKSWNRVMARIERDEYEGARDRLYNVFHFGVIMMVPVTIYAFTSIEVIQVALFGKSTSLSSGLMHLSTLMIIVVAIGIFLAWILIHMGKSLIFVVNIAASWIAHIVLMVLLVVILKWDLLGILLAQEIAFAVFDVMSLLVLFKMLKYRYHLLYTVGIPVVSAAISGLVIMFLNMLLVNLIGEVLTIVVGIVVFTIIYMLILIVLKGITTEELSKVPFGRLFMAFSHSVQHDGFYEE
jgi:O-antigen/teichoic acid export membrane protein